MAVCIQMKRKELTKTFIYDFELKKPFVFTKNISAF